MPDVDCRVLEAFRYLGAVQKESSLLEVQYTSVFEYMLQFHLACVAVKPMGPRAMIYSAAAVSDFYIPYHQMGEHKIQSAAGDPHIPLTNTPKMLYMVTHEWAPEAYTVSFKLETDTAILLQKASSAIVRYNVDCVVANILMTRYQEIRLVFNKKSAKNEKMSYSGAEQNDQAAVELIVKKDDHPLESQFVPILVKAHSLYLS